MTLKITQEFEKHFYRVKNDLIIIYYLSKTVLLPDKVDFVFKNSRVNILWSSGSFTSFLIKN